MNIQNLLLLSGFQNGMVNDYVEEFTKSYQEIDREWLASYRVLGSAIGAATHIFIEEVQRGHIYCDDLFYSLLDKYTKDFNFCDEETRIVIFWEGKESFNGINWNFIKDYTYHIKGFLLCYDFCKEFLHYFDSLIKELHHISHHKDFITRSAILAETCPTKILTDAIKNYAKDIILKMESKGDIPYLHTKNNLQDIIARLSIEKSNPVIKINTYLKV